MTTCVIQDWTDSQVPLKLGQPRDVRYKIYREGSRLYQEIRNRDNSPIRRKNLSAPSESSSLRPSCWLITSACDWCKCFWWFSSLPCC